MALPNTMTPINADLIAYLQEVISGKNPEELCAVACLFERQAPRVFHRPDAQMVDMGFTDPMVRADMPDHKLIRFDSVSSVTYSINPTCSWMFINGRHQTICR